jgi:hypothetical protein
MAHENRAKKVLSNKEWIGSSINLAPFERITHHRYLARLAHLARKGNVC